MKTSVIIALLVILTVCLICASANHGHPPYLAVPPPNYDRFRNMGTEVRSYSTLGPAAGRGLFALRDFAKGEVVERAPLLLFRDPSDRPVSTIDEHVILFDEDPEVSGIGLGYFSLTNHSESGQNAELVPNLARGDVSLVATRFIHAGEEILTHYGENYVWHGEHVEK